MALQEVPRRPIRRGSQQGGDCCTVHLRRPGHRHCVYACHRGALASAGAADADGSRICRRITYQSRSLIQFELDLPQVSTNTWVRIMTNPGRSSWAVSGSFVAVNLATLLIAGWWFASGSVRTIIGYEYGDDPRATLALGQLWFTVLCMGLLLIQVVFALPTIRRRLTPLVTRLVAVVQSALAAIALLGAGLLGLAGGIGVSDFPWLTWAGLVLAWATPFIAIAVGAVFVAHARMDSRARGSAFLVVFLFCFPFALFVGALP